MIRVVHVVGYRRTAVPRAPEKDDDVNVILSSHICTTLYASKSVCSSGEEVMTGNTTMYG